MSPERPAPLERHPVLDEAVSAGLEDGGGGADETGLSGLGTVGDVDGGFPPDGTSDNGTPAPSLSSDLDDSGTFTGSGSFDETVTESDTVGGMDTDAPGLDDDVSQSWHEGQLVAHRFRLLRFIGQGGMGKVYLAQDETLKRPIALKRIPQEIIFDVDARDDLRLEANRLLDLAHENIVRIHTYYDGPTWPFFAMEYLQGPTLKKLLRQRKREGRTFSADEVLVVAKQVAHGLSHAHSHKIVHRDLKPANLMLARASIEEIGESDTIKITDFGISRVVADSTLRQTNKRSGTLPYMSPEQFRGEPCTPRSDIYGLACTLYELVSGSPPFVTGDIGFQILQIEPKPLEDLPRPMASAIARGLAKDPEDRFDSVEEFVAALDGVVRVPNRRFYKGPSSIASKMVAGVVFAGIVLWLSYLVYTSPTERLGPDAGALRGGARRGVDTAKLLPGDTASTPAQRRQKLDEFATWLKQAIDQELPTVVGRRHATRVLAGGPPSIELDLILGETETPSRAALLSRVIFTVSREDADGLLVQSQVPGVSEDGVHRFRFRRLREGTYVLQAGLSATGSILSEKQELFQRDLVVDLTAPAFEVRALEAEALVDIPSLTPSEAVGSAREVFATFEESFGVSLATADGGATSDIAKAYYQVVTTESASEPIEIEDPHNWRVPRLSPGERRTLRIYAEDPVGHRSENRDVVFHRYKMELEELRTVEVVGNLATLQGVFRYEGEEYPRLVFFVNGDAVTSETRIISGESGGPVEGPFEIRRSPTEVLDGVLRSVAFETRIPLFRPTNTVEVQYSWMERRSRPFAKGGFLDSVRMRAPRIDLEVPGTGAVDDGAYPPERSRPHVVYTRKNQVSVHGTVEPYFPGLSLLLVVHNEFVPLKRAVVVDPAATGSSGNFETVVGLEPGVENVVTIESYYRGESEELVPAPDSITLYCDQDQPTGTMRLQTAGDQFVVRVQADEPITLVRGRLVPMDGGMTSWEEIESAGILELAQPSFSWRQPIPSESVSVQVELTDRAGNTGLVKEFFNPASGRPPASTVDRRPAAGSGASPRPGAVILRSPFLNDVDMVFKVCSPSRLELASTEVSEYAWFLFLEEKALRPVEKGSGRKDHPMALEDRNTKLLPEFVRWFEVNAADGYAYAIPTPEDWLRSFTGARNVTQARNEIEAWFGDPTSGFNFMQPVRYGQNKSSVRGSRPANQTPTELLDMESNMQEVVIDENGSVLVIGGHNQLDDAEEMQRFCLTPRKFDNDARQSLSRFTSVRLCRRPKPDED